MSSSSSESDDDSRFRQACDPTLIVPYGNNNSKSSFSETPGHETLSVCSKRVLDISSTCNDPEETRESLSLARKIQCLLNAKDIKDIVSGPSKQRESCAQGVRTSHRRKKNSCHDDDLPSSLSSYLERKLTKLLDEKVEIKTGNDGTEASLTAKYANNGLLLLKNRSVKSCINHTPEKELKQPKKVSLINSYNKKEVAQRCQSIALSPHWILDKRDVYPWPHPKNIRYLERYKIKSRKADGSIKAVPFEDGEVEISKLKRKKEKHKECSQTGRTGEDVEGDLTGRTDTAVQKGGSIQTKKVQTAKNFNGVEHTVNTGNVSDIGGAKKRKQSRKRSGKKAKRRLICPDTS